MAEDTPTSPVPGSPAATGTGTATGQALRDASNAPEIPEGDDRGSKVPIEGGAHIKPDAVKPGQKPHSLQAEPAIFVSNGSIDPDTVATPGGPVPAGATGQTQEQVEQHREDVREMLSKSATHEGFKRIPRATIDKATGAELRAAAADRGWDLGDEAGNRVTRARFIAKQNEELGSEEGDETGEEK